MNRSARSLIAPRQDALGQGRQGLELVRVEELGLPARGRDLGVGPCYLRGVFEMGVNRVGLGEAGDRGKARAHSAHEAL